MWIYRYIKTIKKKLKTKVFLITSVCDSGAWACEELDCPMDACLANQVYVPCVSPCVKSCSNMHEFESCSAATCYGGCECAEDSVWNGTSCVLPTSCPCHHGGISYSEGYIIQTDECHSW